MKTSWYTDFTYNCLMKDYSVTKRLPIDISTLKIMLEEDYLYVDKTEIIHNLITRGRFYFLARPRRFGKSLLISTLKEIFLGNKELFKDLWIGKSGYDWKSYAVLHFDFSALDISSASALENSLCVALDRRAKVHGIDLTQFTTPGLKLTILVQELALKGRVVILIDEYDSPLIGNLDDIQICAANRKVLKNFFSVLKSLDESLKAIFITGVTKFSKTSLFSGLNNLNDITMDPKASTLLGYTQAEIDTYFLPYMASFAQHEHTNVAAIKEEMINWYNGYRFSKDLLKVFNPFSVLYYLEKEQKSNYWLESGTPSFFIELLKSEYFVLEDLETIHFSEKSLGTFDIERIPLISILFQTGYLTIVEAFPERQEYRLDFPNIEVRESFKKYLLVAASRTDITLVERATSLLSQALIANDIPLFCSHIQSLFANVPFHLHIGQERYYHSLLQIIGSLLGLDIQSEVVTDKGRIDLVLKTKTHIYIIELKLNQPAKMALEQIEANKYYEKYRLQEKKIVLVGLSFSSVKKKLTLDWAVKEL